MTTITTVTKTCDNEHDTETPATATRTFTVDGTDFEIDLCRLCNFTADAALGALLKNARTVTRPKTAKRKPAAPKPRTEAMRAEDVAIRAWWKVNPDASSRKYQTRGRLPGDVVANYHARKAAA